MILSLSLQLKITKSETLPEKLKQYLGPAAEKDIMVKMNDIKWPQSVPKEFDLRKEHPECTDLFSQAQDEGACDTDAVGCWDFDVNLQIIVDIVGQNLTLPC